MNRSNLYNVIHLSLSFLLIFMSFNVAQTFQTSADYAKDGAFAVGISYLVFCLSNLALSSFLTQLLGVRLTLIFSSLGYVLFIAANIKYNVWTLYISSFFLGLGSALLWTAQGVYVALSIGKYERANDLLPSSTGGFINGVFFGVYQINLVIGNLIVSILFRLKYSQWIIFTIMTVIAGCGSLSLVFVRPLQMPATTKQHSFLSGLSILIDIPFLLLIPTMCYSGLSYGFIFAAIPPLIIDKSRKFLLFALFGIVNASSAFIFGKLSDILGRRLLIFAVGALSHMIIFVLFLIVWKPPLDETHIEIFITMIICLSIGDAIFTNQLYSIIAMFYGKTRPSDAFACLKAFQSGCTAITFVGQVYLSFQKQVLCLVIVLSLTVITLIYEHYGVTSLDTAKMVVSATEDKKNEMEDIADTQIPLTALHATA